MTVIDSADVDLAFSELLRTGSKAEHTAAESSSFMTELLEGRISPEGYRHYLTLLRRIYEALETTADGLKDDPIAGGFIDSALERLAAIDADLAHWGGTVEVESPATDDYVARIKESSAWGGLFVAHHYTRYLGDLSGGQIIGRLLGRTFELDGSGIDFYAFPEIPKPKVYKDGYRQRLDALPLDVSERARVLDEVKVVFGLNGALFTELTEQLCVSS